MDDKTQGLIRHILTIVGGFAISRGWINEENALGRHGCGAFGHWSDLVLEIKSREHDTDDRGGRRCCPDARRCAISVRRAAENPGDCRRWIADQLGQASARGNSAIT
jgi:hypothetical protein